MSISVSVDEALLREAEEATNIHDPAELVRQALIEKIARESIEIYTDERLAEFAAADADLAGVMAEKKSSFAERWKGKFQLPPPDPNDPRLTYLLDRYRRGDR
jgi:hypothetical protein